MTQRGPFIPSHRRMDVPQPEICDVTGFAVSGADLITADVQGLRGARVSAATPFLARARQAPSYEDRRIDDQVTSIIGQGRLYDAGDEKAFAQPWPQEWSTPQALDELVLWARNDDIPYSTPIASWPVPGGLGLPTPSNTDASQYPATEADPFGSDYRGVRFANGKFLRLELELSAAFTFVVGVLTGAALTGTNYFLLGSAAGIQVAANGTVTLVNDASSLAALSGAGAVAVASAYVLTITRSAAGVTSVRRNGASIGTGATLSGALTLTFLGLTPDGWALSEMHVHAADHSADGRLPALERTIGRYMGLEF